nr:plasmid pRiA4b ORF-3 family protein [Hoyosella altamirensis]
MTPSELHEALGSILVAGPAASDRHAAARPDNRLPRREDVVTFVVRVEINGAEPPLWRRLELASDLLLNEVHDVLQVAFGWQDRHLHRFSSGGGPFDSGGELYLCPFDADAGEDEGVPEEEVRLDEVLSEPGDVLHYVYDYGDNWMHSLKLEKVQPRSGAEPAAWCTGGRRPGPPEDCGGVQAYERAVQNLHHPQPVHTLIPFRARDINKALRAMFADVEMPPFVQQFTDSLPNTCKRPVLRLISGANLTADPVITAEKAAPMVSSYAWLLQRAEGDGIKLTNAGYLPPKLVQEGIQALELDPAIFKVNREVSVGPLLRLRASAQNKGLLRTKKGTLVLTKLGRHLAHDPLALWHHLAKTAPVIAADPCESHALILLLLTIAGFADDSALHPTAELMTEIGWRMDDEPLDAIDVLDLTQPLYHDLCLVGALSREGWELDHITPGGVQFARAALQRPV